MVFADLVRLGQAITNLLGNAVKYTDIGGHICVSVSCEDEDVTVQITDDGIGIPKEMLSRVFELFAQVDSSLEKSHGGLGIGLTLAKRLVELHGGSIHATSPGLGQGSTFSIHLPEIFANAGDVNHAQDRKIEGRASQLQVLVVDDNPDVVASLVKILRIMGHSAQFASDGLQGVGMAESFRPNVVIMDLGMPRLNGYEACRQIRSNSWAKDIVLIALTGWGLEEYRRQGLDSGFDFYLTKPASFDELERILGSTRKLERGIPQDA